ncbi:HCP-like protein [Lentinula aciculospora]|uniref:HCP-like protein n=1 Tax=Lentinula aciculospora TaxID=153920 RepID=A0A9W9DV11_9AGAR|nr:HCP-like protein [Lentinula aciculospora]
MSSFPVPPPPPHIIIRDPSSLTLDSTSTSTWTSSTSSSGISAPSLIPELPLIPTPSLITPDGGSAPHLEDPLAAPRAQKVDPEIPANMARNLDEQVRGPSPAAGYGGISPAPPGYNPGGFNIRGQTTQATQASWSPWSPALPTPPHASMSPAPTLPFPNFHQNQSFYGGSFDNGHGQGQRAVSPSPTISQHVTQPPNSNPSSDLTAPLPTIPSLTSAMATVQSPAHDPTLKVAWIRDVLFLVDRAHAMTTGSPVGEPPNGPVTIHDEALLRLAQVAVPMLLDISNSPEALYHRASLLASGAFPEFIQKNPRQAFRDFESAARAGFGKAWFRIGRDYEGFGDAVHAKECFERGVRAGVGGCMYRLGMAQLLGQLGLPESQETALPLLKKAALVSDLDTPQPAYVYALLLLGEFTQVKVEEGLFFRLGLVKPEYAHMGNQGLLLEARAHLMHSAYLHFSPAQYKLGHSYEFATPPFEFDALLSVEWYSRASQQGETEADMALSKWFLCGSRVGGPPGMNPSTDPSLGGFDKDEQLARIFAEKAARKGLPSAEFAMGYYCEVGIGGVKNLEEALGWYRKASSHGNSDAIERLAALEQEKPQMLSRLEHDSITESKLVRSRTMAKERSEAQKVRDGYIQAQQAPQQAPARYNVPGPGVSGPPGGAGGLPQGGPRGRRQDSRPVVDLIRKNTLQGQQGQQGALGPGGFRQGGAQGQGQGQGIPRPTSAGPQGQGPGVGLRPPRQQAYPTANRYTLVDPGSGSAPRSDSRSPSGSAGGRPPPRRGPSGGVPVSGGVSGGGGISGGSSRPASPAGGGGGGGVPQKSSAGPQTFAEMGIVGTKAEDEKCVIM